MAFGSEDAVTGIVVDRVVLVKQKIQILAELHGVSLFRGNGGQSSYWQSFRNDKTVHAILLLACFHIFQSREPTRYFRSICNIVNDAFAERKVGIVFGGSV